MAKGGPDLKRYMDKTLSLKLNGNRTVKVRDVVACLNSHLFGHLSWLAEDVSVAGFPHWTSIGPLYRGVALMKNI